jgi:hypothetical protein
MSDFCRGYDEKLWDKLNINTTILCEGHSSYEDLDNNGFAIKSIPAFIGYIGY